MTKGKLTLLSIGLLTATGSDASTKDIFEIKEFKGKGTQVHELCCGYHTKADLRRMEKEAKKAQKLAEKEEKKQKTDKTTADKKNNLAKK